MMMFRVESKDDRVGVYQHDGAIRAGICDLPDDRHAPTPNDDEKLSRWWRTTNSERYRHLFGFESVDAYLSWFKYALGRQAIASDHVLAVYTITDGRYELGHKQMVAHEDHMVHVTDLPTTTTEYLG